MRERIADLRTQGLSESALKTLAMLTMLVDHVTFTFLERTVSPVTGGMTARASAQLYLLDRIGRGVGRQAFLIYAFFIAEGYVRTHSRGRYLGRLALFTLISQLPFHLMCYTGPIGSTRTVGLNVYATLALGLAAIWILDVLILQPAGCSARGSGPDRRAVRGEDDRRAAYDGSQGAARFRGGPDRPQCDAGIAEHPQQGAVSPLELLLRGAAALAALAGVCFFAWFFNTDYDVTGVVAIVLLYALKKRPALAVAAAWLWLACSSSMEFFSFPAALLLLLYNGKRGGRGEQEAGVAPPTAGGRDGLVRRTAGGARLTAVESRSGWAVRWLRRYGMYLFYPAHMLVLWALRVLLCGA